MLTLKSSSSSIFVSVKVSAIQDRKSKYQVLKIQELLLKQSNWWAALHTTPQTHLYSEHTPAYYNI